MAPPEPTLIAMKPARETRSGSAALGRNFLMAVSALGDFPVVRSAAEDAIQGSNQNHPRVIEHSPAFGLVGGALGFGEETVRRSLSAPIQSQAWFPPASVSCRSDKPTPLEFSGISSRP